MGLKNFVDALRPYKAELGNTQFWRYTKAGQLPKILTWIVERPELAEALAADARERAALEGEEGNIKGGDRVGLLS